MTWTVIVPLFSKLEINLKNKNKPKPKGREALNLDKFLLTLIAVVILQLLYIVGFDTVCGTVVNTWVSALIESRSSCRGGKFYCWFILNCITKVERCWKLMESTLADFWLKKGLKTQLSETGVHRVPSGCWYHAGNAAVASRAEQGLILLSCSCFPACFATGVLVLSGLTCAFCPSCLTWGELLYAMVFRSLFLLGFLQLPNFDLKSESKNLRWSMEFAVHS